MKHCPFCGSSNLGDRGSAHSPDVVRVTCMACEACGPTRITPKDAELAWNQREPEMLAEAKAMIHSHAVILGAFSKMADEFPNITGGKT